MRFRQEHSLTHTTSSCVAMRWSVKRISVTADPAAPACIVPLWVTWVVSVNKFARGKAA